VVESVGAAPLVSRAAMLAVAAFTLLGVYRLGERAKTMRPWPWGLRCSQGGTRFLRAEFAGAFGFGGGGIYGLGSAGIIWMTGGWRRLPGLRWRL